MLQFRIEPQAGYILVRLAGLVSLPAWQTALGDVEVALAPVPGNRVVVDLTGLLGYLGVPERQAVGALMAAHFRRMQRVALVVQAEKITDVVRSEAGRRGLELRLFPQLEEAVGWVTAA